MAEPATLSTKALGGVAGGVTGNEGAAEKDCTEESDEAGGGHDEMPSGTCEGGEDPSLLSE